MSWNSSAEFWAMGGYAFYVWGSFGVCALAMVLEPWLIAKRRTAILRVLKRQVRAQNIEKESL
jgi:heme exporter protein D